nr:MAG TPA: hypothetical protein [Bacteriophage sp.]
MSFFQKLIVLPMIRLLYFLAMDYLEHLVSK